MNIIAGSEGNQLLLVLLNDQIQEEKISNLVKEVKKQNGKICYVCLAKPYSEVIENLKDENVDCKGFLFIDVLSSLQLRLKPVENCIFVQGPEQVHEIKNAIKRAVSHRGCTTVLFDQISTMLIYQHADSIVKFTHDILTEGTNKARKIYLATKETGIYREESTKLINDLYLFADKVVEV